MSTGLFVVGVTCVVVANVLWFRVIALVNRSDEDGQKISYLLHTPQSSLDAWGRYRRLYPEGLHAKGALALAFIGVLSVLASGPL